MGRVLFANIIRFIILTFVQIFLLKNIGFYNLATPYLYVLFILVLPFRIPNGLLFLLAFLTGITIDVFNDTLGLHAAACTVLAYVRIMFISVTVQKDGFDNEPEPRLGLMGFRWFFFYAFILTFFHHLILLTFETFRFSDYGYTLMRVIFSSLFTVLLMLLTEFIFFSKKVRK